MHIVSELVHVLERSETPDLLNGTQPTTKRTLVDEDDVLFDQIQDEISFFDHLIEARSSPSTERSAKADEKWFVNHLSAGFAED